MLTDERLEELYRDKTFYGSFSGARNFQSFLKTELNEDVPLKRIYSVLKNISSYVVSQKPIRRFPRRQYDVAGFGSLLQADLGFMFEKNGFKYMLVVCDVFSRHLYVEALKDKTAETVKQALIKIFDKFTTPISKFETDQGGEFLGLSKFFRERQIYFKAKYLQHKANFSEHYMFLIKKKLYMMMRSEISDDWPKFLPYVVDALNHKPIKALGFKSPSEINSEWDDVKIRESQKEKKIQVYHEPDWKTQNKNQEKYLSSSKNKFQPGTFVYIDKKTEVFNKSFFAQVSKKNSSFAQRVWYKYFFPQFCL